MNRGLFAKSFRELFPATLLLAVLLLLVETILSYVLQAFHHQIAGDLFKLPFFKSLLQAMVGAGMADRIGAETFAAIPWVHPVVLALLWAHAVTAGSRVPAAEVDRGTIDVLCGLPVSRGEVALSHGAAWASSALVLGVALVCGNLLGCAFLGSRAEPLGWLRAPLLCNALLLYAAAGGIAALVSAFCDRAGKAITAAFVILLFTFLLNYLRTFWKPAERVAFLSLLDYCQPFEILRERRWPVGDLAVLGGIAIATWGLSVAVFARRDLKTV